MKRLGFVAPAALVLVATLAVGCGDQISEPASASDSPQFAAAAGQISFVGYPRAPDIHAGMTQSIKVALERQALQAQGLLLAQTGVSKAPSKRPQNLSLVGFLDLPDVSFDVWAHKEFAYVGGLGPSGFGVRVVDISNPASPQLVNELPTSDGAPLDVKVAEIHTKFFHGDLLVVGNEGGDPGGIQLWDVTNPRSPVLLSEPRMAAVHNAFLYQKGNRAFVIEAVPFAEVFAGVFPPFVPSGDVVILEVTDPRNPVVIADWGAGKDGGFAFGSPFFAGDPTLPPGSDCTPPPGTPAVCRGDDLPAVFGHDVWVNETGTVAYISYWDLGLILLDVSHPANPRFIGRGIEPPTFGSDEGNLHVAVPARRGRLVLVGDEDFTPGPWGFLRIFNTGHRTKPVQVGAFATDGALNEPELNAGMHNIFIKGNTAFLSWYFEGIRAIDISHPSNPREIAAFTAPGVPDEGLFWGVYVERRGFVLGSDLLSGLFILKLTHGGAVASLTR